MKKLLEVLQYGDCDVRFNTDINVKTDSAQLLRITTDLMMAMATTLWGGNEQSVLAIIRALTIADLAVSVNPDEMLQEFKKSSDILKKCFEETREYMEKRGVQTIVFGPGINPLGDKS